MVVLLPSFGMTTPINKQIIDEIPDTFIAAAASVQTNKKALCGEGAWS
ncbi:MAG: hypothetical protein ABEI27_08695 [Halobellus sp.]